MRTCLNREQGSLSLFFVVSVTTLFLAIGLVVDGSGKMRSNQRADNIAAEAARAAAQAISTDVLLSGAPPRADAFRAVATARTYLTAAGLDGTVQVNGNTVTVTATTSYEPTFLSAFGIGAQAVEGTATVEIVRGL